MPTFWWRLRGVFWVIFLAPLTGALAIRREPSDYDVDAEDSGLPR